MRTELEVLLEGFEYDRWASDLWRAYLEEKGSPAEEWKVLQHILAAQEIWWVRTQGSSPRAMPTPEVSHQTIVNLNSKRRSELANHSENPIIHYQRTTGEAFGQRLSRIAAHVIDHGGYHRGQLRAMVGARGWEDFPETALLLFYQATGRMD